jgi:hypothetical protein
VTELSPRLVRRVRGIYPGPVGDEVLEQLATLDVPGDPAGSERIQVAVLSTVRVNRSSGSPDVEEIAAALRALVPPDS